MADLLLNTLDLATVRFTTSPALETALAVRVLQHDATGLHGPWVRATRERLARQPLNGLDVLLALIPRQGLLADVPTPSFPSLDSDLPQELATIRDLDPAVLLRDLELLDRYSPTASDHIARRRRSLADNPDEGLHQIASALEEFWDVALAPHWARIHRLLRDDIARRSAHLARHGLQGLVTELSPRTELLGDRMRIQAWCFGDRPLDGGRGLHLVSSVFCPPQGLVALHEPFTPRLIYHARGVGNLWSQAPETSDGLDDVLGRTRAQLLRMTGIASSTSELAHLLGLAPGTVSEHLAALRRAGLVTSRREGRTMLHARTDVAEELLHRNA